MKRIISLVVLITSISLAQSTLSYEQSALSSRQNSLHNQNPKHVPSAVEGSETQNFTSLALQADIPQKKVPVWQFCILWFYPEWENSTQILTTVESILLLQMERCGVRLPDLHCMATGKKTITSPTQKQMPA